MKKLKDLIWNFWFIANLLEIEANAPWPPKISSQPWSTDFIKFVPNSIESLVKGCAEIGAKNHIVVKKNLILFIFLGKKSASQKVADKNKPKRITMIVRNLYIVGKMKGSGENGRKMDWNKAPATTAAKVKTVVAQLIYGSFSAFAWSGGVFIFLHREQKDKRRE